MSHRITHERAPLRWEEGLPLGNGRVGVMAWGDGAPLRLTLDHADLWDLRINDAFRADPEYSYAALRRLIAEGRFDEAVELFEARERRDNPLAPTKISIGRAEAHVGSSGACRMSLDIDRALVEGRLGPEDARQGFAVFVHRDRDLICLRGASGEPRLRLVPLAEMTPGMADLGHPAPTLTQQGDVWVCAQELIEGPSCAVAWCASGSDTFLAVGLAPEPSQAVERATASVLGAREQGFDGLLREHLAAWERFWAGSAVHLPEQRMELLWYYGVYLLACSARPGARPPGLQGVWAMDGVMPPWRGDYHADMNVQETFWPACCSGHLELLDVWCDHMRALLPESRAFARRFLGTDGSFWPCSSLPGLTSVQGWYTVQFAWSSVGWLAWLVWLRWRYSLDTRWLAETGYPLVSDILCFYRANVEEQADGYLHVPLSTSPEYRENKPEAWCQDPAIDLALIRRCCDWVTEMEDALGLDDLKASARALRERLAPYPLTEGKVLCLWPGKPLDESHRHPSHLMPIHPAMDLTVEGTEEAQQIIAASVEHFLSLGQYRWAGHTYAQMVSFAAVLGRAGWAYDCLLQFAEHWIGPNGLHFNADLALSGMSCFRYAPGAYGPFTMEANCGIAAGIGDMLVQGWNDRVRVFPAVPDHWREIAFRDLLTEGAFRVSAIREAGRTVWVRIRATVDRTLRLRDPFAGEQTVVEGCDVRREGDDLVADLQAGQVVTFALSGFSVNLDQAAEAVRAADTSRLGLRAT
jgi:alpha-L-fucosidase 2